MAHAVESFARQVGIGKRLREFSVITSWERLVGEQIAKVTEAERFEKGILYVKTKNAPWRTELTMKRLEIIERINSQVGGSIVKDIRFR